MRDDILYRHYKGDYYFAERGTAIDATNGSTVGKVIVYRNLKGEKFVREADEFFDANINYHGGFRFKPVTNYRIEVCEADTEDHVSGFENEVPTELEFEALEEEAGCLKMYVDTKKEGDAGRGRYPYFEVGELSFETV